jgi:putative membrane protein
VSWRNRLLGPDPRDEGRDPDPRFSFANERTFLAWNRTGLALISVGLAVTQLLPPFTFTGGRKVIGLPLIALGALVSYLSLREWAANELAMRRRDPLPRTHLVVLTAVVIAVIGVVALVVAATAGVE